MPKALIVLLAVFLAMTAAAGLLFPQPAPPALHGKISLSGAWALYPMAIKWAEEFRKLHPQVKIDVQAGGAGKGLTDALNGMVDIGMVSRDVQPAEVAKGAFPLAVTKDGVVATISAKNPLLAAIKSKGLTKAAFIDIWITGKPLTWGQALGTSDKLPVRVFTRSDACGAGETWAAFLGKKQEDLGGVGVYGDPGLADAARRDPLAIGFNNINFAYDAKTLKPIEGLAIVPIDLDGNRRIDPSESFYATRNDITKAIADNKYPSPPARDLYFVTKNRPTNPAVVEFMKWVLNAGQTFVPETGYIPLAKDKLAAGLARLAGK
jgi:phosphate transport system substrate-binding protein